MANEKHPPKHFKHTNTILKFIMGKPAHYEGQSALVDAFYDYTILSLISYYPDGQRVPTPMLFVNTSDKLYVRTHPTTYKTERIRQNSSIQIAPCMMTGFMLSEYIDVQARILDESDKDLMRHVIVAFNKKYGLPFRLLHFLVRSEFTYIEISQVQK